MPNPVKSKWSQKKNQNKKKLRRAKNLGGEGSQTDKHLPQSPFPGHLFLDDEILHCFLWV